MIHPPMISDEYSAAFRRFRQNHIDADVVVAGAGLAGICAAVAAARAGVRVVLISDRPVLGGNCSSEIRVPPRGAAMIDKNLWARETGLIEEISLDIFERIEHRKFRWEIFDEVLFDFVMREENITLLLNTVVDRVETVDGKITEVGATELRTDTVHTLHAKEYIDCTGDGTLGYLAGATYRYGREARSEFNEACAPEHSDLGVMGATLLFKTKRRGVPVTFKAPSWATDAETIEKYIHPEKTVGRDIYRRANGDESNIFYGLWWLEVCDTDLDQVYDAGEISLQSRKIVLGLWDYIKNSGKFEDVEDQEIDWIGVLPGKRESRRLIGPTIVSMNDLMDGKRYEDRIGAAGWSIDVHPPRGYLDTAPSTTSFDKNFDLPSITDVPLSALYSKDIANLYFAGRNVSCSHFALGALRVQAITAMMGQAVGTSAVYSIRQNKPVGAFTSEDIQEIQRQLVRADQSIIGYRLQESDNLALRARVEASSVRPYSVTDAEQWIALDQPYGLFVATEETPPEKLVLQVRGKGVFSGTIAAGVRPESYGHLGERVPFSMSVDGVSEVVIDCPSGSVAGKKLFLEFDENPGLELAASSDIPAGSLAVRMDSRTEFHFKRQPFVFCFRATPEQNLFAAECVTNGMIRTEGTPNLFASCNLQAGKPESITLKWDEPQEISRIEVVFVTNLDGDRFKTKIPMYEHLVKEFRLLAVTASGEEILVAQDSDNMKRLRCWDVSLSDVTALTLDMFAIWGLPYAQVHEIRVY